MAFLSLRRARRLKARTGKSTATATPTRADTRTGAIARALLCTGAAFVILLTLAGTSCAPAHSAPSGAQTAARTGPITPAQDGAVRRNAAQAVNGGCNESRTSACENIDAWSFVKYKNLPAGYAHFTGKLEWRTEVDSKTFTAELSLKAIAVVEMAVGSSERITATCSGSCSASGWVGGPVAVGRTIHGVLHFTDSTTTKNINAPVFIFTPIIVKAGALPAPGIDRSASHIRCDDLFSARKPGCVNNDFIPTMTSMAGYRRSL
jgi:hypothetical protein